MIRAVATTLAWYEAYFWNRPSRRDAPAGRLPWQATQSGCRHRHTLLPHPGAECNAGEDDEGGEEKHRIQRLTEEDGREADPENGGGENPK
jgi:hypothetical protein